MANDACTHHLGSVANNERVTEVLIYLHLQPIGFLILFFTFSFFLTAFTLVLGFSASQGSRSRASANEYATYNTRNEVLFRTFLL